MANLFGDLLGNQALEDLKSNKTIEEKENNYFLIHYGLSKAIHTTPQGKSLLDSINHIDNKFKGKAACTQLLIYDFYQAFNSSNEIKKFFKDDICEILKKTEDELYDELYEIKYIWEYETVLYHLYLFVYDSWNISTLEKRDRKKIYDEKGKFERNKNKTIEFLKAHDIQIDKINNLTYNNKEKTHLYVNYESSIKHIKELLYTELTQYLNVGKERAKKIIKILTYI